MKYLKTFELLISDKKEYYKEITQRQYSKTGYHIAISDKAINIINKNNIKGKITKVGNVTQFYSIENQRGYIMELEDEWFVIMIGSINATRYFLCDQLERLDKCLSNFGKKIKY